MSISFSNYVEIDSGVAGNANVATRELMTRMFTTNPLVPTGGVALEFSNPESVRSYFGVDSVEYKRALFYFSWVSKLFTSPQLVSFSRWASANTVAQIFGANLTAVQSSLALLQAVTTGAFALTLGATTHQVTGLDFSAAVTLANVATALQTAIRTFTGTEWTAATVTYNSVSGGFDFNAGDASVAAVISVAAPASGTDIRNLIGWLETASVYPNAPIFSDGVQEEAISETLGQSASLSNNFGSFLFIPSLTQSQVVEAATTNMSQNVTFMYLVPVIASTAAAISAALINIGGAALTLAPISTEYPEMVPGMILAATDYDRVNSTQNYMFQQFNLTPSVTTDSDYLAYNEIGVNFYGQTQTAGQPISFYQTGVLTGTGVSINPIDQNVYANEIWFKNAAGVAIMQLLLSQTKISANAQGTLQIMGILQDVIGQALNNGTISTGNTLTAIQIVAITTLSGSADAWYQVQNSGYWVTCVIQSSGSPVVYTALYTLIYKKDDVIRKVSGSQILI